VRHEGAQGRRRQRTKKTIKNKLTITYEKPGHRSEGATSWPETKFKPQKDPVLADIGNTRPTPTSSPTR
jgi:hypothetical protein